MLKFVPLCAFVWCDVPLHVHGLPLVIFGLHVINIHALCPPLYPYVHCAGIFFVVRRLTLDMFVLLL
jgi:hypothetical protein